MDILSQAMALTGITESAVDIDYMPIIAPCESDPTVSESPSLLWSSYQSRRVALEQLWEGTGHEQIAKMYGLQCEAASTKPVVEARKRNPYVFQSMKAKVNIPGFSARCLQSKIQTSGFERTSAIQLIKADGCDIHKGVRESVKHKWLGDVDLVDRKL